MGNYNNHYVPLEFNKKFYFLSQFTKVCIFIFIALLGTNVYSQDFKVTGNVTDSELGETLPGVSIIIKGTTKGTETDFDGNFEITVNKSTDILIFSYLGYKSKEVSINGRSTINVGLATDLQSLDEIVIIGYGSSKKSDLTGSVVTIGGDDIKKQPISNVAEALTGRLPGVQVSSTEGSPDAEINIRVRGGGSLTQDSSPLIIVDGFPVNSLSDISSSDIENMTVLKDASSTAIYGSRGANGVIIVTTKSGKLGKVSVNFNMFNGYKKISKVIDVQDAEDFVKWQYEYSLLRDRLDSYESVFGLYQDRDQYNGLQGNNWQQQIYGGLGEVQSRDLSIRGGSEKVNFNFNYAVYDEKTIMLGSDFKRNNLSLSLKSKASDKVDLAFTIRYSDTEINGGGANEQNEISSQDSRLKDAVGYSPIPIPGVTTVDTDEALANYLTNPFISVSDNQRRKLRKNFNLLGSVSWEIIENLKLKSDFGLDNFNTTDYRFYGRSTYYARNRPSVDDQGLPSIILSDQKRVRFRNANTINYDFKNIIGQDHSLKLLLGQELIVTNNNEVTSEIQGFPKFFDFETALKLTSQGNRVASVDNYYSPDDKLLSYFGRANYSFLDKYLLTATFRADGSSKFIGDNIWGYFPSAAVAWKINEESFIKDVTWINALKLRLSYGEAGNNNIPTGQTVQNFQSSSTTYINNVNNYWAASNRLANPDLKWETTVTQNIGLDFAFLNNRVSGSIEAYKNLTTDLLFEFPVPGTGYSTQFQNIGEVQNTGFEASLNITAIEKENYGLSFNLNASVNKNRINSLGSLEDFNFASGWASSQIPFDFKIRKGGEIGEMYGYMSDGRYEISDFTYDPLTQDYTLNSGVANNSGIVGDPMPGNMKLKDISGPDGTPDGIVDENDITLIGNANPGVTGGFVINANAHGFDLSAAFNYTVGNDIYNANKVEFTTSNQNGQYRNLSTEMSDGIRWTNLNPTTGELVTEPADLAALNQNTTLWSPYSQNYVFSDWAVEDGSFLRLNTLTLGYTLKPTVASKIGASNLRFYATANNVFILTNYSGPDPEVSTRRKTPLTPGVDYSAFPRSRSIVFGVNLNF
ncbi:MAG: SusC/RagA family TonB-linked outer membrane protein [Flavobacteriales bacterium]